METKRNWVGIFVGLIAAFGGACAGQSQAWAHAVPDVVLEVRLVQHDAQSRAWLGTLNARWSEHAPTISMDEEGCAFLLEMSRPQDARRSGPEEVRSRCPDSQLAEAEIRQGDDDVR